MVGKYDLETDEETGNNTWKMFVLSVVHRYIANCVEGEIEDCW